MNKSTILNITMAIAIVILYILHFTGNASVNKTGAIKVTPRVISKDSGKIDLPVAYVDMDSLNEKITYIKKMRKQLEAEQEAIEKEWENGYRTLEVQKKQLSEKLQEKQNLLNQKKSRIKTKADADAYGLEEESLNLEAESAQQQLYQQKQQIDSKKESAMMKFGDKSGKFLEDIHDKLKKYIASYNEVAGYRYVFASGKEMDYMLYKDSAYNITNDIAAGMNDLLKDK